VRLTRFVRRELNDSKMCSMLFKDFQQEQLFQKSKSYFKNLMNYSLTKCFSFIKTWDSLSSEFAGEAVHFPSLYRLLRTRILHDPEFQFYLLYVNNILKYEKGRKEMGLTNSVIFKILFIMLKKEEMRFEEKSIFKDTIQSVPTKRVKTETPTNPAPSNINFKSPNIPETKPASTKPIIIPPPYMNNPLYPFIPPNIISHDKPFLQNKPNFINHPNYHVKPIPHIQNIQPNINPSLHNQPQIPIYPIQRHMMNPPYPKPQLHKIYPSYPNLQKNYHKPQSYSNMYGNNYTPKHTARKPMYQNKSLNPVSVQKKKVSSPLVKNEKKSSVSEDSISISSSSISFSPDSGENFRRKSKIWLIK
jgi:hypothetical protein